MTVTSEEWLRNRLHEGLGDGPACEAAWADIVARSTDDAPRPAARRPMRRPALAAALVIVLLVTAAIVAGTRGSTPQQVRTVSTPPTSGQTVTSTTPTTTVPPQPVGTSLVTPLGTAETSGLEALPNGAWVALWGTGQVVRVDDKGQVTTRLTIGKTVDSGPLNMAYGEGAIWILAFTSNDQLLRVDPESGQITGRLTIPAEAENVAVGNGKVWVTACCATSAPGGFARQRLYRINPQTLAIEHSIAVPGDGESNQVKVGTAGIYLAGEDLDTIARLDPTGTRILAQPEVGGQCVLYAEPPQLSISHGRLPETPAAPTAGCFINDINNPNAGQFIEINADDRTTTVITPGPVNASTVFGGHLVIATPLDLYELDGTHWRMLGRHPGVTQLSALAGDLWAVQGNQLQKLQLP